VIARPLLRSFLYVPGDRADRVSKALQTAADAVLVDLEDAVALSAKESARQVAVDAVTSRSGGGPAVWVRINAGELGRLDAAALASTPPHLGGVVLAKCDDPKWLDEISAVIPATVPLSPLVESARGVRRLDALCAHPRVTQCHLGEIDLLADLGAHGDAGPELLGYGRAEILYASAAAGILPPIGGVYPDFRDAEGLKTDSAHLAQLGFAGRPAIHPSQTPTINAAFRPSAAELETASALVASYDEALARGRGVVSDEQGRMIDEAVVRRARQLLGDQRDEKAGTR
jgi:citrate lyase subunit beta/citryl-CoA lyase